MTKMKKVVFIATVIGLTTSLFAGEPNSLKKSATAGLIGDGLVDNLAVGIDDAKGMVFGGYNGTYGNVNLGYGSYFGPAWVSIYDVLNNESFNIANANTVTSTDSSKDGVAIEYTDKKYVDTTKDTAARDIDNKLYISGTVDKVGAQAYWLLDDDTPTHTAKTKTDNTDTKAESHQVTVDNQRQYLAKNTFGAYLYGLRTKENGKFKFYAELKDIGVAWYSNTKKDKYSDTTTYGADSTSLGTKTTTKKNVYRQNNTGANASFFSPYVTAVFGLSMPGTDKVSNVLEIEDTAGYLIPMNKDREETVEVDYTNSAKKVTTTTKKVTNRKDIGSFTNTLTPKFTSTYDLNENLKLKTRLAMPILVTGGRAGQGTFTKTITDAVTEDLTDGTSTKTHSDATTYAQGSGNGYTTYTVSTKVNPQASLGLSYAVKPGKCDLNFGLKLSAGTFGWDLATKRAEKAVVTSKSVSTDEFGQETVTADTTTVYVAGQTKAGSVAKTESRTNTFYADGSNAFGALGETFSLGTTLYFTENVQMDILFLNKVGSVSIVDSTNANNGILTSSLGISFAIKF